MRVPPHKPKMDLIPSMIERIDQFFDMNTPKKDQELDAGNGDFYAALADQCIVRAALGYVTEDLPKKIGEQVREGLKEMQTAYELGHRSTPWEAWDFFLAALAVNDRAMAHFMASLPEESWIDPRNNTLAWLAAQVKASVLLFQGDDLGATRQLEHLHAFVFEEEMPKGLQDDLPEIQTTFQILKALLENDGAEFHANMAKRDELRIASFEKQGGNAPITFLDLNGLGLCRLAWERGMEPSVESEYMPAELLTEA